MNLMSSNFLPTTRKYVKPGTNCVLILQPSFRSIKRLQHLYFYLLQAKKNFQPIVLTPSLTTLLYLVLRGIACRFYMKPFVPLHLDDEDIINLNTLLPIAMTEISQHGRLRSLFVSKWLAKKSLLAYACLSKIFKSIESSYTNVHLVSTEAALADHISSYQLSSKYQSFDCKWISLVSPSNLVGLTQGDPSIRRFRLDEWNYANKERTTRDYRSTASSAFALHSSSYLSCFENRIYKSIQHASTALDLAYSKTVVAIADLLGITKSPAVLDIIRKSSKPSNYKLLHILKNETVVIPEAVAHNQQIPNHVVIHFMSSPGESFANTASIMTDADVIGSYLETESKNNIRFILKLHPHFEDSYSRSDLKYYESMGIEIWDPRAENPNFTSLLGDKKTIVTTAFGSIYLERILQGLPVFCFNYNMHIIKSAIKPKQFFSCIEDYVSWYHQKKQKMSCKLISSTTILDLYDPRKLFPNELIDAIIQ
jgi:hypothetical protein